MAQSKKKSTASKNKTKIEKDVLVEKAQDNPTVTTVMSINEPANPIVENFPDVSLMASESINTLDHVVGSTYLTDETMALETLHAYIQQNKNKRNPLVQLRGAAVMTILFEAEGCSFEEKVWVGLSIRNRQDHPEWFQTGYQGLFKDYSGWSRTINFNRQPVRQAFLDSVHAWFMVEYMSKEIREKLPITFYVTKDLLYRKGLLGIDHGVLIDRVPKEIFGINHKLEVVPAPVEFKHVYFKMVD
jgi:hypothetical protein